MVALKYKQRFLAKWSVTQSGSPVIYDLLFDIINILQDISVDGWALTLLSDEVLGAAANMQTMGQLIGSFSWNIYFSLVIDKTTYPTYIKYWSIVYLISTILVLIFVKEKVLDGVKNSFSNLFVCFKNLFRLFTLRVSNSFQNQQQMTDVNFVNLSE